MTDTKHISDVIKGLPENARIEIRAGLQHLGTTSVPKITTADLKALVAENEHLQKQIKSIAFYAQGHEEPNAHCALCLIEAIISGKIPPIEETDGGDDDRS